jgi:hypothetical protein
MSDTYTKLFRSITASTIVSEPLATRWLWVTMLSQADSSGCVWGSVPGLARLANITLQECEAALACFYAPDPYSRTQDHEGRRIEAIDGGWRLLNHAKYGAIRNEAERRSYKQRWDQDNRPSGHARSKATKAGKSDKSPTAVRQSDSGPTAVRQSDKSPLKSDSPTPPTPTPTPTPTELLAPDTPSAAESLTGLDTHRGRARDPGQIAVAAACRAMKAAGLATTSTAHPELLALVAAGASPAQFGQAAAIAVGKGKGLSYALGTLRGQLADANAPPKPGKGDPEMLHHQNRAVAAAWLADQGAGDAHERR